MARTKTKPNPFQVYEDLLRPEDKRGEQLYVQTLFDADRFDTLNEMYEAQLRDYLMGMYQEIFLATAIGIFTTSGVGMLVLAIAKFACACRARSQLFDDCASVTAR